MRPLYYKVCWKIDLKSEGPENFGGWDILRFIIWKGLLGDGLLMRGSQEIHFQRSGSDNICGIRTQSSTHPSIFQI